jgi:cytolysin-activating lysine-acyltransferase
MRQKSGPQAPTSEQIKAGVFPIRLQPNDWGSGEVNWLLDVIASDARIAAGIVSSFQQKTTGGTSNVHPALKKMFGMAFAELATARNFEPPNGKGQINA